MKIGMYTEDEILEHLTEGEGRGFLGRSMYDAIFDKIHALITENEQLKKDKKFYADAFVNLKNRNDKAIEKVDILRKAYERNISPIPCTEIDIIDKVLKGEDNNE